MFVLPASRNVTAVTVSINVLVLGGLLLLVLADSLRRAELLGIARDWYPLPLMLLAYREMGWLAQPHLTTELEESWVVWDRLLLNEWGLRAIIESLGPLLPSILEISYTLVYSMAPFALAMLYLYQRRERAGALLFNFLLGVLAVYVLFPLFPSEPPWTVFPGQDYPACNTIFRQFNVGMLSRHGIHASVFPSAHVAGSFCAAFAMIRLLPEKKWVGRLLLFLAVSITLATVYGRYHYAVDALAGFAIGAAATAISARLEKRRLP